MKIKKENKINENGSYSKTTIIKTRKEDGWNDKDEIFGDKSEQKNRYFKGKSKSIQYETNNPKITRPFTIIVSIVGILISIILLVVGLIFKLAILLSFGIVFLITIISFLISSQKDIKKIENDLNKN